MYETVVPAGHTATPIANPVTIEPGVDDITALPVVNVKKSGPDLPLTGAQGVLAMTIGGLVLISMGAAAIALSKRRRESAGA